MNKSKCIQMTNDKDKNQKNENTSLPPEEETLHTPDPQEHMEGPVSSTMHNIGAGFDSDESKEEADEKRDKNM